MGNNYIKGIHHVCMKVKDIPKTVGFYTDKMGYTIRFSTDKCAMLNGPDGSMLEFFPEGSEKGYAHVAYICDDVDKAYKLAVESGCESVKEPSDAELPTAPATNIRIAFFKDPMGNKIELFHEYKNV